MLRKWVPLTVGVALLLCAPKSNAGQKYNPFEDRFETAPDGYKLKYDPFDNEWSYESPKSELEYNPFEDTWGYNPEPRVIVLPDSTKADLFLENGTGRDPCARR